MIAAAHSTTMLCDPKLALITAKLRRPVNRLKQREQG